MTRLELVKMRESGRLLVGREALAAGASMRTFNNPRDMVRELRKHVMLKWMHQHHEMELSAPGENTHGFEGTPEW